MNMFGPKVEQLYVCCLFLYKMVARVRFASGQKPFFS